MSVKKNIKRNEVTYVFNNDPYANYGKGNVFLIIRIRK